MESVNYSMAIHVSIPGCKGRQARTADNLTAICEPIV
jgi:hypothetical protein